MARSSAGSPIPRVIRAAGAHGGIEEPYPPPVVWQFGPAGAARASRTGGWAGHWLQRHPHLVGQGQAQQGI